MSKLYALFDYELNTSKGLTLSQFADICKRLDAKVLQYRDKVNDIDTKIENLTLLKSLFDGLVLVNDTVDLAVFCDGVHLGQEDLAKVDRDFHTAVKNIRKQIGKKVLGLSTHNKHEIELANTLDVDYIGLGAYRDTSTKKDIKNILGDSIKELVSFSTHPVAVIGGVKVSDKIDFAEYKVVGSDLYLYY